MRSVYFATTTPERGILLKQLSRPKGSLEARRPPPEAPRPPRFVQALVVRNHRSSPQCKSGGFLRGSRAAALFGMLWLKPNIMAADSHACKENRACYISLGRIDSPTRRFLLSRLFCVAGSPGGQFLFSTTLKSRARTTLSQGARVRTTI